MPHVLVKVSLFKAFKANSKKPYLKAMGRYQTKEPHKKSSLIFKPGEGCAGLAYQLNYCITKHINEYDPQKPSDYYSESEKIFKLSINKAKKLNDKACHFLCIPVRYFGEDKPWGILSIDAMKNGILNESDARNIENILSCFSVFLMLD